MNEPVSLPSPPGYAGLVPLDRNKHAGLGVTTTARGHFAGQLNAVPLLAAEFTIAARHYPIVFVRDGQSGKFVAMAVCGLRDKENLFLRDDGEWDYAFYVPAYIRRWPFFSARIESSNRMLICVDESVLESTAEQPFFALDGEPGADWEKLEELIKEMDSGLLTTLAMLETLSELELLESFEAHAYTHSGSDMHLKGMFRVDEKRLNQLEARDLQRLMKKGYLSRIYAHLISLNNFRTLLDRAAARETVNVPTPSRETH